MDKFLIELLLKNNSVILPDFGAIVIANESTGEVMFNEYLKFNDGKLIALIVANSSMEEQDALNMVAKYIRDIQIQLDKGESYDIFGLGSFNKDKDGSTIFEGNVNASTKKEEEIAGPSPTPKAEPKKEKKETPKKEEKVEKVEEQAKPEIDLTASIESKEEKPKEDVPVEKEKKGVKKKEDKPKKVKPPKEKKENKKRGILFWIIIFLLVVVTGGGVFVGLKYEEVKAYMGWDKFDAVESVAALDETISTDDRIETEDVGSENDDITEGNEDDNSDLIEETNETEEAEEVEETEEVVEEVETVTPEPVTSVATDGKPFHLIGGSFSEATNADKFVAELKSKGFPAHVVGQFNGLHMVSVKSFSTRSEAMGEISTIQNEASGAWLFKFPK